MSISIPETKELICYDETFGTWFMSSEDQVREMQHRMNEMLEEIGRPPTLREVIDILNSGLPDDKKIKLNMNGWGGDESLPLTKGDKITWDGVRCKLNGEDVTILSFVPNASTEDWVLTE